MDSVEKRGCPQGYKQTEVGMIPEDWKVVTLDELSEKIMVGIASAATHAYRDRGIPLLRNQNIKPNYLNDEDVLFITKEYEVLFKNKRLKVGDLLTARTGYPGTTCLIPEKFEDAQSFTTLITRLKRDTSISEYICYYMNSEAGEKFFELNQIGGGQKNVNAAILRTMPLPLPKKEEQTAIAKVLSDVDALIISLETLITKKRAIKTAAMQQLLTGKKRLPPFDLTHTGYKQTELGEIPEDWEVKAIGGFCSCFSGGTPSTSVARYYGGNIPWITSGDLNKGRIKSVIGRITELGLNNSSAKKVSSNTLLFALYGATAGVSAITNISAAINQAVLAIQPDKSGDKAFLFQVLRLRKDYLIDTYTQGGQPNFSGNIVKSFLIALPSIAEEQIAIANVLSDMDKEIDALEQRLNKTQQLKQGMMQELLTGRTRLI
jgi:type I restriction enzyme S subunit